MARFVKLTQQDGALPLWLSTDGSLLLAQKHDGSTRLDTVAFSYSVRESPEQILALLAEPVGEVTEAVARAAWAEWTPAQEPSAVAIENMRAAIEAADRARGLRP